MSLTNEQIDLVKQIAISSVAQGLSTGAIKISLPAPAVRALVKEEIEKQPKTDVATITAKITQFDQLFQSVVENHKKLADETKSCLTDLASRVDANAGPCMSIKVDNGVEVKTIKDQLYHCQFKSVVDRLQANSRIKRGLWLHGAAGGGKTTMAMQIAEALDVKFVPIFGSPTLTDTKLLGYNNAGTGDFVRGSVYDAYSCPEAQERGALLFIDEADAGEFMLVLNALLANDYYRFANGEVLHRPKKFYILAAANTLGRGSSNGYRRATLDFASLDRFTPYKLEYDVVLETKVAGCPDVSDWVIKARAWIESHINGGVLTPRTHFAVAEYYKARIPNAHQEAIAPLMTPDNWAALLKDLPAFPALPELDAEGKPVAKKKAKQTVEKNPANSAYDSKPYLRVDDAGSNKIGVIKIIRSVSGLGLKESKDIMEGEAVLAIRMEHKQAIISQLSMCGAKCQCFQQTIHKVYTYAEKNPLAPPNSDKYPL